jgi:predicted ATP-dependent endonuclease of OLD family
VVGEAVSMTETFITHIRVDEVRNISDLSITLSGVERQHLIVTGKNGCGKTSFLLALNKFLMQIFNGNYENFESYREALNQHRLSLDFVKSSNAEESALRDAQRTVKNYEEYFSNFGGTEIVFTSFSGILDKVKDGDFVIAFFNAKRQTQIQIPSGINQVPLRDKYSPNDNVGGAFVQYIVNLKAERSFARDDGDEEAVRKIDDWFTRFEKHLSDLFGYENLRLVFDRKNYNFFIDVGDREKFSLFELSDGYSAVINIVTEIMLRMEAAGSRAYDLEGIVVIDEIETHLHVELQKKILPFLCDFFPRIQFIVSTHSPFVLSSVENAVICDLQNRIVTEDLSGYSYDTLIESYFKSDKYSDILKRKVARYEALADMPEKSDREMDEYFELKDELSSLPKYLAPELDVKLKQIELKHLS